MVHPYSLPPARPSRHAHSIDGPAQPPAKHSRKRDKHIYNIIDHIIVVVFLRGEFVYEIKQSVRSRIMEILCFEKKADNVPEIKKSGVVR